jgi:hypothetical protein
VQGVAAAEYRGALDHDLAEFDRMVSEIALEATPAPSPAVAAQNDPTAEPVRAAAPVAAIAETPETPALEPGPALLQGPDLALEPEAPPPAGSPAGEPLVLESDPEINERLRFLVWMRRLRDRSRGEVTHVG